MRRVFAIVAAALGAASLALFPMAGAGGQVADPVTIYDSSGVGQGIVATFAVRPSIFDPLAQGGLLYASSLTSSQGGGRSYSIASQAFPGTFAIGALGCKGLPGGTFVQALYPPTEDCHQEQGATVYKPGRTGNAAFDAVLDRTDFEFTHIRARADLGFSDSTVETLQYGLFDEQGLPIVAAKDFDLLTTSTRTETITRQRTDVTAKDVQLLGGGIRIGLIRSIAETSSNAVVGTADTTLTISDVTVNLNGTRRAARITNEGIVVTDPALSREERLGAEDEIREELVRAGVAISVSSSSELIEGSTGEASVGGLSIAITGQLPSVTVPAQLTPVLGTILEQIPTQCLSDFGAPVPLCFGAGVLPGGGSAFPLTLQIAGATAFSAASTAPVFDSGSDGPPLLGGVQNPDFTTTPGEPAGFAPPATTGQPTQPAEPAFRQSGPLTGLVARMPAGALLWIGAALLIVAVGLGMGPSLGDARRP